MGPYCKFCGHRCFVLRTLPDGSWTGCMATCAAGMEHDRKETGYDHSTAVNAALVRCNSCDRPTHEWPGNDCDGPELHTTAAYDCECGETVTIEQAIGDPSRHARCHLIGVER
jgi:hypothetical protein